MPKQVRWVVIIHGALALLQLLVGFLLLEHRDEVIATLRSDNPSLPDAKIQQMADGTVFGGLVVHAVLAIIYTWLGWQIGRGRGWARIVTTIALILGAAGGVAFFTSSGRVVPNERTYILFEQVTSLVFRLVAIWLLWSSPVVKRHLSFRGSSREASGLKT